MVNEKTAAYMRAVAEEGSFSKAAAKLYISQPSLSENILKAEKEYGVSFFNRKAVPVVLTSAGELYLQAAEEIEQTDRRLARQLQDISSEEAGRITVGESPTMSAEFIPELFRLFHNRYPDVQLALKEGSGRQLIEEVRRGHADLAFVSSHHEMNGMVSVPAAQRRLLLVHSADQKTWSREVKEIDLHALENEPFILLEEGREIRSLADDLFDANGFRVHAVYETKSYELALQMARAGLGWTFAVERKDSSADQQLQYYHIREMKETYHVCLIYRKDTYLSKPMQYLLQIVQESL